MKASELRIGNWVFDVLDKKECVVEVIDGIYEQVATLDKKMDDYERTIKPEGIPLTEEWLIKFGFKWSKFGTWINHQPHRVFHVNQKGDVFFRPDGFVRTTVIKYVHQLQNLYFALTGEELTIK